MIQSSSPVNSSLQSLTLSVLMVLLCSVLITACNGQRNEKSAVPEVPAQQLRTAEEPVDPYFVMPFDTVSSYGPQSITRNMLQDQRGTIWFASWEGIVGYDGHSFTNYTLKYNLRKFHMFSVLEDRAGNLWFGSIRGGLYRYDPNTPSGTNPFRLFTIQDGLASDLIECLCEDQEGFLWIGTDQGVTRLNLHSLNTLDPPECTNFSRGDGLADQGVHSIAMDKTGRLWFGTDQGLSYYDMDAVRLPGELPFLPLTRADGTIFHNVRSIIQDRAGILWIGCQEGLYSFNAQYSDLGASLSEVSKNFIGYLFEDNEGSLWVSESTHGSPEMMLSRYDGQRFLEITRSPQVFGIMQDRLGNVWFGTVFGPCRYNDQGLKFFSE